MGNGAAGASPGARCPGGLGWAVLGCSCDAAALRGVVVDVKKSRFRSAGEEHHLHFSSLYKGGWGALLLSFEHNLNVGMAGGRAEASCVGHSGAGQPLLDTGHVSTPL